MHHQLRICVVISTCILLVVIASNLPLLSGQAAGPWYVSTLGDDANTCDTPAAPCKTITGPMDKPAFIPGDTIKVATGVYTSTTGSELVVLNENVTLSGGWNGVFTEQNGMSTLQGGYQQRGVMLQAGQTASIERFVVQNGWTPCPGILNYGDLSLRNIVVNNNTGEGGGICNSGVLSVADSQIFDNHGRDGGGISNSGSLTVDNTQLYENTGNVGGAIRSNSPGSATINRSIIRDNWASGGGGISVVDSTLILNECTILGNESSGLAIEGGQATINNSTISDNHANTGGGVYVANTSLVTINNSTIVYNFAQTGGGIYTNAGAVTVRNSIVADNQAFSAPECSGAMYSYGYNLFGNMAGCAFAPVAGDLTNTGPGLGALVGSPGYYHLLPGSPAIDAGNPAAPGSGGNACLLTDQRGVTRNGPCDIGAYEYTTPGQAASITVMSGTGQRTAPNAAFWELIRLAVLDSTGGPAANVPVTFTAPSTGPSAIFAGSGTQSTTVYTDHSGFVSSPEFYANNISGAFAITASSANPAVTASMDMEIGIPWYVTKTGNDANNCLTPATACGTITAPLAKPGYEPGDTIKVATGIFTSTSATEVLLLDGSATLSGGWNEAFTEQNRMSTIDGGGSRRGVTVISGQTVRIEHFIVQNGSGHDCPGIYNQGTLNLDDSEIRNNTGYRGGGICNEGMLTVSESRIAGNQSNDGAGIYNNGVMTVTNGVIEANRAGNVGGGIYTNSSEQVSVSHTILRDNHAGDGAGGVFSISSNLALNDSQIIRNETRGLGLFGGHITINNCTISHNISEAYQGLGDGGGIFVWADTFVTINNTTISHNIAGSGAGIHLTQGESLVSINGSTIAMNNAETGAGLNNLTGTIALRNTILAENISKTGPDCRGNITSFGYNLVGDTVGCTYTPTTGDLTNISSQLGPLVGSPAYHYLLPGSPAINAANPALPGSGGNACPLTDQRGVARSGRCEIGAYEYTLPGSAARIAITAGAEQHTVPYAAFTDPFRVAVLDAIGSPVANARVTFAAPSSGPSAVFSDSDTYTTTVFTDPSGFAASPDFYANGIPGTFSVTASTGDPLVADAVDLFIDTPWYAATQGSDGNDCQTPVTPCATVAGVLGKTGFVEGAAILLGDGTYTGTGSEVIRFNKGARVWGGWNAGFTSQTGASTIDGQGARRGIYVNSAVTVALHNFVVQNAYWDLDGGGIDNEGNLTIYSSEVKNNTARSAGGIYTPGTLLLIDSLVSHNSGGIRGDNNDITLIRSSVLDNGEGIWMYLGTLTLDNSTVAGNTTAPSGIEVYHYKIAWIYNTTITDFVGNPLGSSQTGISILQNSIIANNVPQNDCRIPAFASFGYNLIGNAAQCTYALAPGDQIGVSPRLIVFGDTVALLPGSPAIDAGNPAGCIDSTGNFALLISVAFPAILMAMATAWHVATSAPTSLILSILFASPTYRL